MNIWSKKMLMSNNNKTRGYLLFNNTIIDLKDLGIENIDIEKSFGTRDNLIASNYIVINDTPYQATLSGLIKLSDINNWEMVTNYYLLNKDTSAYVMSNSGITKINTTNTTFKKICGTALLGVNNYLYLKYGAYTICGVSENVSELTDWCLTNTATKQTYIFPSQAAMSYSSGYDIRALPFLSHGGITKYFTSSVMRSDNAIYYISGGTSTMAVLSKISEITPASDINVIPIMARNGNYIVEKLIVLNNGSLYFGNTTTPTLISEGGWTAISGHAIRGATTISYYGIRNGKVYRGNGNDELTKLPIKNAKYIYGCSTDTAPALVLCQG